MRLVSLYVAVLEIVHMFHFLARQNGALMPKRHWRLSVKVGDIVKLKPESWRTDRIALVVERFNALICWVVWSDTGVREKVNSQYFEVINANR